MDDTASVATARLLEGFGGDPNVSDIESEATGIFIALFIRKVRKKIGAVTFKY